MLASSLASMVIEPISTESSASVEPDCEGDVEAEGGGAPELAAGAVGGVLEADSAGAAVVVELPD